jgi:hypothetical protein
MGTKASTGSALRPLLIGAAALGLFAFILIGKVTGVAGFWVDTISLAVILVLFCLAIVALVGNRLHPGRSDTSDLISVRGSGFRFWLVIILIAVIIVFTGWRLFVHLEDIPYLANPEVTYIEDVKFDTYDGRFSTYYHLKEHYSGPGEAFDVPRDVYRQGLELEEQVEASGSEDARLDATIEYLPHSEQVINVDYEIVYE